MKIRTYLFGAAAALALSGGALAGMPVPEASMPAGKPVVLAQSGDVGALQEEIRRLNGRVEELNFQILQMQEQLRKMQEDTEFRFQELEGGKKSDAGGSSVKHTDAAPVEAPASDQATAPVESVDNVATVINGADGGDAPPAGDPSLQAKELGTIRFDQQGNVVGGKVGDQALIGADPNGPEQAPGADNTVVAALPQTDNPETLYQQSYEYMLSGQYATAEAGFADHTSRFPKDARAADARFWLGEAQLGQRKYREAAETFLAASKAYPKSKKAPDMLLKLGVSLVGLNQRTVACATFSEIGKRYPNASSTLQARVKEEQATASC